MEKAEEERLIAEEQQWRKGLIWMVVAIVTITAVTILFNLPVGFLPPHP